MSALTTEDPFVKESSYVKGLEQCLAHSRVYKSTVIPPFIVLRFIALGKYCLFTNMEASHCQQKDYDSLKAWMTVSIFEQ